MAGGADGSGEGDGADDGFGDYSQVDTAAHDHRVGIVEGGAGLVPSSPVDFSSDELRQVVEVAAEPESGVSVVITQKFLRKVGAQAEWSAQREDLEGTGGAVEGGSAGSVEEQGGLGAGRNERGGLYVELIEGMNERGALKHAGEGGDDTSSGTGDGGAVLAVPDVAQAELASATCDAGKSGTAHERGKFGGEDLVSEAEFTAAAGVVAEIEAASGTLVAEDGDAGLSGEGECPLPPLRANLVWVWPALAIAAVAAYALLR